MSIRQTLTIAALAAGVGGLIMPVLAQNSDGRMPDQPMSMRHMGHGMMGGGTSSGMMNGGCAGMMQSMNGDRRPNSQWRTHPPSSTKPD